MRSNHSPSTKRVAALTAAVLVVGLASAAAARSGPDLNRSLMEKSVKAAHGALSPDFVPPGRLVQRLTQPDGTSFAATLSPATTGGLFETSAKGYSVDRDEDGVWRYVVGRAEDGSVQLAEARAGIDKAPAGLKPRAGRKQTEVDPQEARMRADIQRQLQVASYRAQMAAAAAGQPRLFKVPAVLLATWWDPSKGQNSPQFQPGTDTPEYFEKVLTGFGGNPQGSVTQFYYESSFGQMLVQIDVYGPYVSKRSLQDRCYYGGTDQTPLMDGDLDPFDTALGIGGAGALGMALEVVSNPLAQAQINWADYDNNGDQKVDFTMLIHSGADMATTGDPCNTWSHAIEATLGTGQILEEALGLPPATVRFGLPTKDGVFLDRLLTMPEFAGPGQPVTIGVAAHEMAHALGEPDYYDTSYSSTGTGDFDVMAGGSYLGNSAGSNPTIFSPASRVFQGWVKPKVVQGDLRDYRLRPRTVLPKSNYTVKDVDENLLLVPTYEISVGETDKLNHTWTELDVLGLAKNPKTGKYIVEGWYIENVSRTVVEPPIDPRNSRAGMFDRKSHGSGLMVWHFDYWRQSNTYYGANDAQSDPNRQQMDVEEFDQNDNTQDLQLNFTRGNASEYLVGAATGITSGTRKTPPGVKDVATGGAPQLPQDVSGVSAPGVPGTDTVQVENNPNNKRMLVTIASNNSGDCKLQLVDPNGKETEEQDSGFLGQEETVTVKNPIPGEWTVRVGDFAACGQWSGRAIFEGTGGLNTQGAADTWSNWSGEPTGWAFTNVSHGDFNGLDGSHDAGGTENITLDVLNLKGEVDVSPGFIAPKENANNGRGTVNVGRDNAMSVPVFSNGSKNPAEVVVEIRNGSKNGPLVARKTVNLGGYDRKDVNFTYRPSREGVYRLFAVVDPANKLKEKVEDNNVQLAEGWAGPANPRVLVVDDDDVLRQERSVQGALASLGVPYATAWKHPTAKVLKKYDAVIWEGHVDRYEGQLNKQDRAALRSYLESGGQLLISSNRIFDALGTPDASPQSSQEGVDFARNYLGSLPPNSTYTISQEKPATMTGQGVLSGIKGVIQPPPGRPFDVLTAPSSAAFGSAKGVATLDKATLIAVQEQGTPYLGVSVDGNAKHGNFRTVTLGYNVAQHADPDDTVRILREVLDFFDVRTNRYDVRTDEPVVYHSTVRDQVPGRDTPVTAFVHGGDAGQPVTLFYRLHGQGQFHSKKMQRGDLQGTYSAVIPGKAVTPDGVDYYIKAGTGSTYSPSLAGTGRQYHAIGVQLPELANPLRVLRGGNGGNNGGNGGDGDDDTNNRPGGSLAATGLSAGIAVVALVLLVVAGLLRARRRSLEE